MSVAGGALRVRTGGGGEILEITEGVRSVVATSGVERGVVTVFVTGSTAAITTMECEPGAIADLGSVLHGLAPPDRDWDHNRLNHDDNAHAHLRASLIGASESVPVVGGEIVLGTWQQLVLLDFDTRPRGRVITVQIVH